jgi:hypothetical protein
LVFVNGVTAIGGTDLRAPSGASVSPLFSGANLKYPLAEFASALCCLTDAEIR